MRAYLFVYQFDNKNLHNEIITATHKLEAYNKFRKDHFAEDGKVICVVLNIVELFDYKDEV